MRSTICQFGRGDISMQLKKVFCLFCDTFSEYSALSVSMEAVAIFLQINFEFTGTGILIGK